jgi:ATP-dependent Lhr-like helicase
VAAAEEAEGGYAAIYRILAAAEEAGRGCGAATSSRRWGAAQFATGGAIDRLRSFATVPGDAPGGETARTAPALVLAATDPANPFGAAIPWPERPGSAGHLPGRKAGALVVLSDGELVLYVERGRPDPPVVGVRAATAAGRRRRIGVGSA